MSTPAAALAPAPESQNATKTKPGASPKLDLTVFAGVATVVVATVAGIATTHVRFATFFQPAAGFIVIGGTLGVMFLCTPRDGLAHSVRRLAGLAWATELDRSSLIEEILVYAKNARPAGLLALEPLVHHATHPFLKESLLLMLDVHKRSELQSSLEAKIRLREVQGESDARVLDVAGGFAPTIGVLGTVIGLIDILRDFSNLQSVASGVGTAFVSTIYGLGLANLFLLPAAQRIRSRLAETFETHEMILEGILCIYDGTHPSLVRDRLNSYLRPTSDQ